MKKIIAAYCLGFLVSFQGFCIYAKESKDLFVFIADDGKPVTIVAPQDAALDEAVAELGEHLKKITGQEFPVQRISPGDKAFNDQHAGIVLSFAEGPASEGGFNLRVTEKSVHISGRSVDSILFGIYEVLERLGVRWFMPGELGTVIPDTKRPQLPLFEVTVVPSFQARYFGPTNDKQWDRRMRMGGERFPSAHRISLGQDVKFEDHPEWFGLVDGQRVPHQLCISNPEVLRKAVDQARKYFEANPNAKIYGLGPSDGGNFCECPDCRALDSGEWDAFSAERAVTDRYIWFFNKMLDELDKTNPEKSLGFYAYHTYMLPPRKVKPNPRIIPALAPIALCRIHGMNNPICPDRSFYHQLIKGWTDILPQVFIRDYWFNLADPGFPFNGTTRMKDEIRAAKKGGIYGWRAETVCHWASELPMLYMGAKLMWNSECDTGALLDDFYKKFFGPASALMKVYFETMDVALNKSDFHAGGAFYISQIYTADVRKRAGEALKGALRAVKAGPYRSRAELVALSFQYLQQFIAMLDARNNFAWDTAMEKWKELEQTREKLVSYTPPMLNPKASRAYLDRFFKLAVTEGYERSHNGNRVVATLSEQWDFLLDPARVGEKIGFFQSDSGGNWQKISAYGTSWSSNGLHYYRGLAWYRHAVEIGDEWKGKRVFLWFGGVDETARVWLNGQEIGISSGSAFVPFEMDATDAILPGKKNVVTVCVANDRTNEIGTGGIMAPVMFYAPAEGSKATLKNTKPLKETFP